MNSCSFRIGESGIEAHTFADQAEFLIFNQQRQVSDLPCSFVYFHFNAQRHVALPILSRPRAFIAICHVFAPRGATYIVRVLLVPIVGKGGGARECIKVIFKKVFFGHVVTL